MLLQKAKPVRVLNSQGQPIRLTPQEKYHAEYTERQIRDRFKNSLGVCNSDHYTYDDYEEDYGAKILRSCTRRLSSYSRGRRNVVYTAHDLPFV